MIRLPDLNNLLMGDIRGAANFGIKNDENADTVLSVLFSFFEVADKVKSAIAMRK